MSPRRFSPLKLESTTSGHPKLQGIVFDMDGTLCEPQTYMFAEMRAALGIPKTVDILDHVYSLPTPEAQAVSMQSIRDIESVAMVAQVAQPGLVELMAFLDANDVRKAICTRNFDAPVAHLLEKFLADSVFGPIVTREFRPPKPHPAGILHIAKSWGLFKEANEDSRSGENAPESIPDASSLIMVGDSIDDMTAGRRAGAATVLLVNTVNQHLVTYADTDLVIQRLDDLIPILEDGFVSLER